MLMRLGFCRILVTIVILGTGRWAFLSAWTPVPVEDDPTVRMPGTQPNQGVVLEGPNRCLNCHADYDPAVEPGLNWKGSMMAQAARDPMLFACLAVAAQDAIWAVGNPNATDICLRCHFPAGWLGGRSDPTNASAMAGEDFDGLTCDSCHTMWDPFYETTYAGTREGNDWAGYWDEFNNTGPGSGTLSQTEADKTYAEDLIQSEGIALFSGGLFFQSRSPKYSTYSESGSGQYFTSTGGQKRASFADANATHQMFYSRYHKSKYFCSTCHDVSNPVLANLGFSGLTDHSNGADLITEQYSAHRYFHVERTFSEFMLSAYGQPGGAATNLEFQNQGAPTITHAASCQDCHLRDVAGVACNKKGAVSRPGGSSEHPNSGLPLHDMTGGNSWISHILASLDPNGPVYDPVNVEILDQGPAVLTLDLNAGQSPKMNGPALKAGSDRAKQQVILAATLMNLAYDSASGSLSFRVQNNTGHKLISGFPEGRRMFVSIKAYRSGSLIYEVNPYDAAAGTLRGLEHSASSPPLGPNERYEDRLVYEVHPSSDLTGEEETFHFVLATGRHKDNRIPPKGFDISKAGQRLSEPVWEGASAPGYFTASEYAGGYDDFSTIIAPGADRVEVTLSYQGTSREYIEFLRDEINGTGGTLPLPAPSGEAEAYIAQTDPFFAQLKAWGDTIWQLWRHNHGLDGSGVQVAGIVPFVMAEAAIEVTPSDTMTPTVTSTAMPTVTVTPTATLTPTPPFTATVTIPATATPVPSSTPVPTDSPTNTASATETPGNTPTRTSTPTWTATSTPTETATGLRPTDTATLAPPATATNTPSASATSSPSESPTSSATGTPTETVPSPSGTATETPIYTPTSTVTNTPPPTFTLTETPIPSTVTPTVAPVPGDTNGDGLVNGLDVLYFSRAWHFPAEEAYARCDVVRDGTIDEKDLMRLAKYWK